MVERALIVAEPWASMILDGEKVWEMRSRKTNIRDRIGIITKGTGHITGEVDLVDCYPDLTDEQLEQNIVNHRVEDIELLKEIWHVAWVLRNPERYPVPIKYTHPLGAVTWVKV